MLVEFIGTTGSGKTTLIRRVERRLSEAATVTTAADLVTGLVGLRRIQHPTVRNLIQEIVGFPFFLSSLPRYGAFIGHTARLSLRQAGFSVIAFNNLRSIERKIGVYGLIRRRPGRRIVLFDEGPLQAAHLLVRALPDLTAREIARFVDMLPMPDAIVHVKAPLDAVVRRTLQRADPPREIRSLNEARLAPYAEAAADMFERVVLTARAKSPVLSVENPDVAASGQDGVVDAIVSFIIRHRGGEVEAVHETAVCQS